MGLLSSADNQVYAPKADGSRTTLHFLWRRAKTRLFQVLEENGFRVERALSKSETESDDFQQVRIVRNWTDTKEEDTRRSRPAAKFIMAQVGIAILCRDIGNKVCRR